MKLPNFYAFVEQVIWLGYESVFIFTEQKLVTSFHLILFVITVPLSRTHTMNMISLPERTREWNTRRHYFQ